MLEFFRHGRLEMAASAQDPVEFELLWGQIPINRIAVILAVVLLLVSLMDIMRLAPSILNCLSRWKANINLEHSLSQARVRNRIALIMILPFVLIADRYLHIRPSFLDFVPETWSVLRSAGIIIAYFILRSLLFISLPNRRMRGEYWTTLRRSIFNYFIVLVIIMLASTGIIQLFGIPDGAARMILLIEAGLAWLSFIVKQGQILSSRCSSFSTFLYLCGLEILPAGIFLFTSTR